MTGKKNTEAGSISDLSAGQDVPRRKWVWILVALLMLIGVLAFIITAEDTADVIQAEATPLAQIVSVEALEVGADSVEIKAFAEVRPRWSAELRAAVSGRIETVHDSALAGEHVEVGTQLISIENSRYVAELAAAELSVKQARLALWKAENATTLARREFKRNNTTPPNDLALRLPELEIARSAVASSEARVIAARRQLDDTGVVAPFSSFVAERFVSPGQTVNAGDPLIKLVDDATFELTAELSRRDWDLLKRPMAGLSAPIISQTGETIAQARVRRVGGFLDDKTRQYKVFLEVDGQGPASVLSGDFVQIILPGISVSSTLNIAASAFTQEGYVWHLDEDNRLQRTSPRILFRRQDRVIIEAPGAMKSWRIATTPLVSFLPGQLVRAQESGSE